MKIINNKIVDISSFEKLSEFIMGAKVEEKYNFPESFRYKYMEIDFNDEGYSWTLERNYKVCGSVGYVFPLASINMVKTFKTEKGAKRNLIKTLSKRFNQ